MCNTYQLFCTLSILSELSVSGFIIRNNTNKAGIVSKKNLLITYQYMNNVSKQQGTVGAVVVFYFFQLTIHTCAVNSAIVKYCLGIPSCVCIWFYDIITKYESNLLPKVACIRNDITTN